MLTGTGYELASLQFNYLDSIQHPQNGHKLAFFDVPGGIWAMYRLARVWGSWGMGAIAPVG
jgi:hypothetical protein